MPLDREKYNNVDPISTPSISVDNGLIVGDTVSTSQITNGKILYSLNSRTYIPVGISTVVANSVAYQATAPTNPSIGQIWVDSSSNNTNYDPNLIRRKTIVATGGQTAFTADLAFTDGYEQVFLNGLLLTRNTDYTTTNSIQVNLNIAAVVNDVIDILSITNLNSVSAAGALTTSNTFTGAQAFSPSNAAITPITFNSAFNQTANFIEFKNYSGSLLGYFNTSGVLNNGGVSLSSYGQIACQATDTGISISGGTGYPNGGTIVYRGNNGGAGGTAANGLEFLAGGTEKMRLTSAGVLDIKGSATPLLRLIENTSTGNPTIQLLDVSNADSPTEGLEIKYESGTGNSYIKNIYSLGSLYFQTTGANTRLAIDSNGNINQGGSSPVDTLRYFDLQNTNSGNSAGTIIRMITNNAANTAVTTVDIVKYRNGTFVISNNDVGATSIIQFSNAGGENMRLDGNKSLLVGYTTTNNAAYKLQVNSQIFATSTSIATSDAKFKKNIKEITGGLNMIDSLRPVQFDWKKNETHNFVEGKTVGFIAQEVQEALKNQDWVGNLVKSNYNEETKEEFLGLAESNIIPLLVSAVKELKAELAELKGMIK